MKTKVTIHPVLKLMKLFLVGYGSTAMTGVYSGTASLHANDIDQSGSGRTTFDVRSNRSGTMIDTTASTAHHEKKSKDDVCDIEL